MVIKPGTTEDVFNGISTPATRRLVPSNLLTRARRGLDQLNSATVLETLGSPPGNRLEALKGDRAGQHSIRINDKYRICFRWVDDEAREVEIVDYH